MKMEPIVGHHHHAIVGATPFDNRQQAMPPPPPPPSMPPFDPRIDDPQLRARFDERIRDDFYSRFPPPTSMPVPRRAVTPDMIGEMCDRVKRSGLFDDMRKRCLEQLERLVSFQQLRGRLRTETDAYLDRIRFTSTMDKEREFERLKRQTLRKTQADVQVCGVFHGRIRKLVFQSEGNFETVCL